jgi:hypothetical protein
MLSGLAQCNEKFTDDLAVRGRRFAGYAEKYTGILSTYWTVSLSSRREF